MKKMSIVGLGAVVVDEQMLVDHVPMENEKEHANDLRHQIGGPVPTALTLLQRFGHQCHFIGPWGHDGHGAAIERDFATEGLTTSQNCRMPDRNTGIAHVWTECTSGSRTIVAHQCGWNNFELSPSDIGVLRACSLLHLDGNGGSIALQAAKEVCNYDGRVTVDAGSPKSATSDLIPLSHVFSFPKRFAEQYFDDDDYVAAGKRILELGADMAVCTRGHQGATLFTSNAVIEVPAFQVDTQDSTGAGDVFCGGLIHAILNGNNPTAAVRTGAAAAALKCEGIGNREALPSLVKVQRLMKICD